MKGSVDGSFEWIRLTGGPISSVGSCMVDQVEDQLKKDLDEGVG